ncbi:MAG: YlbF family regulator [Clostridiales bacterium]|nr:YlbF family regulator [Clostridiales bacterium]
MNQQVADKAKELARIISLSPEYISMRATEDAAGQDALLKDLFAQYDEIHRQVEDATLRKEPDFDKIGALSRDLETVLEQIKAQPLYQALQKSRKAFSDMMAQVNAELSSVLNPGGSQGGCSGNCSACSGCS